MGIWGVTEHSIHGDNNGSDGEGVEHGWNRVVESDHDALQRIKAGEEAQDTEGPGFRV
jgi:hypothetical protein